jgi:excisionase family DNA binding protein
VEKLAYTVNELLELIGISRSTLYNEIGAGRLKARKLNNRTIFLAEEVHRYLQSLPHLAGKGGSE